MSLVGVVANAQIHFTHIYTGMVTRSPSLLLSVVGFITIWDVCLTFFSIIMFKKMRCFFDISRCFLVFEGGGELAGVKYMYSPGN